MTTNQYHENDNNNDLEKKHEFVSRQEQNSIELDGSKEHGFSPKALLLAGLAGCSGIDVVDILEKCGLVFLSSVLIQKQIKQKSIPKFSGKSC